MPEVLRIFNSSRDQLKPAVDGFIAVCKAKNLSPNTIEYYSYRLNAFLRFLQSKSLHLSPADVTPKHIRSFLVFEREQNSATTAHHSLLTLRVFFGYLTKEELIPSNPALLVEKPKRPTRLIATLTSDQCQKILETCHKDFLGVRDRAILLTMLDTGLRVQELITLEMQALSIDQQVMTVIGKGDKERLLPFGASVRAALTIYLAHRGECASSRFFVNQYGEVLTRHSVRRMIISRGKEAGIKGVRLSPHTLRHTFAKQWLMNGGDAFSLQRMLGHTTLDMVRNYVNLVAGEVQAIHRNCSPVDRMTPKQDGPRKRKK